EHTKALGMYFVEMNNLDLFIGEFFAIILRLPPALGQTVYVTPKSGHSRAEMLENVVDYLEKTEEGLFLKELFPEIRKIISRNFSLVRERNSMAHALWMMEQHTGALFKKAFPLHDNKHPDPKSTEEIQNTINVIRKLQGDAIT